jgi:hypothetical protein
MLRYSLCELSQFRQSVENVTTESCTPLVTNGNRTGNPLSGLPKYAPLCGIGPERGDREMEWCVQE